MDLQETELQRERVYTVKTLRLLIIEIKKKGELLKLLQTRYFINDPDRFHKLEFEMYQLIYIAFAYFQSGTKYIIKGYREIVYV